MHLLETLPTNNSTRHSYNSTTNNSTTNNNTQPHQHRWRNVLLHSLFMRYEELRTKG
jgi:hypothetical protein